MPTRLSARTSSAVPTINANATAEDVVRQIARQIGMTGNEAAEGRLGELCQNLKQEFVTSQWQLGTLDSFQWQSLGAPVGLAGAIRHYCTTNNNNNSAGTRNSNTTTKSAVIEESSLPSFVRSSKAASILGSDTLSPDDISNDVAGGHRTSDGLAPPTTKKSATMEPLEELEEEEATEPKFSAQQDDDDEDIYDLEQQGFGFTVRLDDNGERLQQQQQDDNKSCNSYEETFNQCCSWFFRDIRAMLSQFSAHQLLFHWAAFPLTDRFRQSILHSKPGIEVKAHTVFTMEMNILVSALVLGAAVELWGVFPSEAVSLPPDDITIPYVPPMLAMIYHLMSGMSVLLQLLCTAGWIWTLYAAAAVSPKKFKRFLVQIDAAFSILQFWTEMGQNLFTLNVSLLVGSVIASTTPCAWMRNLGYSLPLIFVMFACRYFNFLATYIGRVAYHGMLLIDNDLDHQKSNHCIIATSKENKGIAAKAEMKMKKDFHINRIDDEYQVLDIYNCTKNVTRRELSQQPIMVFENNNSGSSTSNRGSLTLVMDGNNENNNVRRSAAMQDILELRARGEGSKSFRVGKRALVEEMAR